MEPPNKILITSDESIMEYVKTIPKNKNNPQMLYVYKFIESVTKTDLEFVMTPEYLAAQLKNYFKIL